MLFGLPVVHLLVPPFVHLNENTFSQTDNIITFMIVLKNSAGIKSKTWQSFMRLSCTIQTDRFFFLSFREGVERRFQLRQVNRICRYKPHLLGQLQPNLKTVDGRTKSACVDWIFCPCSISLLGNLPQNHFQSWNCSLLVWIVHWKS